ncbi:MAG: hypothetical protein Q8L35_01285 [Actinomycetota bacterium]|nr:hypothetical protein [Actinomycetota bacterium]
MVKSRVATIISMIYLGLGVTVYIACPGAGFLLIFGDTMPVIAAAGALAATLLAASSFRPGEPHKKVWQLLAIGLLFYLLGELSWWIGEVVLEQKVPYPSIADVFWLAGYFPFFAGFVLNFRHLDIKLEWRSIALWFLPLGVIAATSFYFIFLPVLAGKIPALEKFLDLAYPIEDILLLAAAFLTLTGLSYGVLNRPWKLIVAGFILMLIADLLYSYLSFIGLYRTGSFTDLAWVAGYLLIGIGALLQWEIA